MIIPVTVAAGLVVAAGGVGAYAAVRGPGGNYRTAVAGLHSVDAVLPTTGTVEPASSATVSFPISGSVATVPVSVGSTVSAGSVLATVDSTALRSAVAQAKSAQAQAQLTLEQDQNGGSSSSSSSLSSSSELTANFAAVVRSVAPSSPASAGGSVAAAQRAVERAQQDADAALSTADRDLTSAAAACSTAQPQDWAGALGFTATDTTATPVPTASPSAAPTPSTAPTSSPTKPGVDVTACLAALKKVQSDQTATQAAQRAVSGAQAALTKALAASATSGSAPGGGSASGGPGGTPSGGSTSGRPSSGASSSGASSSGGPRTGAPAGGTSAGSSRSGGAPASGSRTGPSGDTGSGGGRSGSAGGGRTITPEQITADEAAVTAAAAQVMVAQQNLDQATLRSPIAGTVAAVGLTAGDQVGANSGTATIQVVGAGAHQLSVAVDVTKIPSIKVGQTASVQPDGGTATLAARVTAVGVAPATSGGTTYPVTLTFTGTPAGLRDGISAAVTIATAQAASALAVPTSAVTRTAGGAFVTVLGDGRTTRTRVEVGAVGPDYTQITSGLKAGAVVVLADLSEAVPSSSTTNNRFGARVGTRLGGTGITGGFGGTPPR